MPVLRSWRFWGALVALIITWRVTIKAEIRPLLCSAAAACVEALVCAVLPDRVEACNGVRIFPKVRKKTELTNTWTAISGIKFSFRKPCEKYHIHVSNHINSREVKVLYY